MNNEYCIFASVGDDQECFKSWYTAVENRNYDIVFCYYGDDPSRAKVLEQYCDMLYMRKGSKFQNLYWLQNSFNCYSYIFVVDDDISFYPNMVIEAFHACTKHHLSVASPAHHPSGKISHMIMKPVGKDIRRTNFVEMTAMFLSQSAFQKFCIAYKPAVDKIVGYGIDYIIHYACFNNLNTFAILDFFTVTNPYPHTKKNGSQIDLLQDSKTRENQWYDFADINNFEKHIRKQTYKTTASEL